jgi:hypothetical protein
LLTPPRSALTLRRPSGPTEGGTSTAQGRPHSIFKRAIQRRNVVAALAAARELPQLSLEDALELTLLVARKDPRHHQRLAARWLLRYLEEDPAATVEDACRLLAKSKRYVFGRDTAATAKERSARR